MNGTVWPRRLRAILFIALVGGLLLAARPLATTAEPAAASISLSSILEESTASTARVTVTGAGFTCTTNVIVTVRNSENSGPLYSTPVVGKDNISLTIDIPINSKADTWTISASQFGGLTCQNAASARFYAFSWSVSPGSGGPGGAVQVSGRHFPPGRNMPISFITGSGAATNLGDVIADAAGNVNRTVSIPNNATVGYGRFNLIYHRISTTFGLLFPLISSKPFAVPTDLTIAHLETTQVIQRWDNSVPLVMGKPTVVRVYVRANGPPGPLTGGRLEIDWPLMDVFRGTTHLGTIGPINRPIQIAPTLIDPRTLRDNTDATFNFLIPSSWTSTAGIRIVVTLNSQLTTPETNRTNNTATANLAFVETAPLNIVGLMYADPTLPYPAVPYENYAAHLSFLRRTWPVPRVILHKPASPAMTYTKLVNLDPNNSPYFPGSEKILDDTEKRRMQATVTAREYYWYVLAPWDTCRCGLGDLPPGRTAIGQDNRHSLEVGMVMAQEIGHNHGQLHTGHVNAYADPDCCPHGGISRNTGNPAYGFDTRTLQVVPPGTAIGTHTHDFMSYGTPPYWVSDYTYERLLARVRVSAAAAEPAAPAASRPYIFVSGIYSPNVRIIQPTYILDMPEGIDDGAGKGEFALELRDDQDQVLFTRFVDLPEATHKHDAGPQSFNEVIPYHADTRKVVLRHGNEVLTSMTASPNAPKVEIIRPAAGAHWDGKRQIEWAASDEDGDPLVFAVHYSTDNGETWLPLAVDLTETTLDVDADFLKGSRSCLVRVIASDGLNTTIAVSGVFGVEEHMPEVTILAEPVITNGGQVLLHGEGYDADDGMLPDESLRWQSSIDGELGTGGYLATQPLTPGRHTITLIGTDSADNEVAVSVTLQIGAETYLPTLAR